MNVKQATWIWNIKVFIHFSLTARRSLKLQCSYQLLKMRWKWISLHEFWLWLLVPIDIYVPIFVYQLGLLPWSAFLFLLKTEAKYLCKVWGHSYIIFNIKLPLDAQRSKFYLFFMYSQNTFLWHAFKKCQASFMIKSLSFSQLSSLY